MKAGVRGDNYLSINSFLKVQPYTVLQAKFVVFCIKLKQKAPF